MKKNNSFKEDHRLSNPALHLLYVKCATKHLLAITKAIRDLDSFSNFNLFGATFALDKEYKKLIRENAAYADAYEIINGIVDVVGQANQE